jgi:hypothetical protein
MGDHQYTAITNLVILHLSISRRFLIITGSNHLGILLEFYGLPQSCRLGNNNLWRLTTAMGAVTTRVVLFHTSRWSVVDRILDEKPQLDSRSRVIIADDLYLELINATSMQLASCHEYRGISGGC